MNYAKAVRGVTTNPIDIQMIESQAEIELARTLTKDEKQLLSKAISPSTLCKRIKKV